MDHLSPTTELLLICSLVLNGFWVGNRLVPWCRQQQGRLLMASLILVALEAVLFYFYVFASLASELHIIVHAVTSITNGVLICCFNEWVKILPRPWGQGGVRDQA